MCAFETSVQQAAMIIFSCALGLKKTCTPGSVSTDPAIKIFYLNGTNTHHRTLSCFGTQGT